MSVYEKMKEDLLAEFQKGCKSVTTAVRRINKKRQKDDRPKRLVVSTAKKWWDRFKEGDTDIKRRFLDNCQLKIENIRWTHSCRLERDDRNWESIYFDGRFLIEANTRNCSGELCVVDTFHGQMKILKYTVNDDDPRLSHYGRIIQYSPCLFCKTEKDEAEIAGRPLPEKEEPKYLGWCKHIARRFINDRHINLRETKPLDSRRFLVVDSGFNSLLTMRMNFEEGTLNVEHVENMKEKKDIKFSQVSCQDIEDPFKFLLLRSRRNFGEIGGRAELDPFSNQVTTVEDPHNIQMEPIEEEAPALIFPKYENRRLYGLGVLHLHRAQYIDLSRLYEYNLENRELETKELDMAWANKRMKILTNSHHNPPEHPHTWIDQRLYVCSRKHCNNRTSIIVLNTETLEWTDMNINVNGSITALLRSSYLNPMVESSEGILLVRVQKKVPKLEHISRYVRIPTSHPDNLTVLVWTQIRNYCESRPPSITNAINALIPPILRCPFKEGNGVEQGSANIKDDDEIVSIKMEASSPSGSSDN